MKGIVSFVNEKQFGDKLLHSFRLTNDDSYYNCGTFSPDVRKGELVEFDGEDKGGGKFQVNVRSVKILKEAGQEVVTPNPKSNGYTRAPFKKFVKDESKEAYWTARELRDVTTQQVIQLQSSRNSAIALADVLIKNGAVNMEKIIQAKKQGTLIDLVDELTLKFEEQANAKRNGEAVEKEEDTAVEAVLPTTMPDDWE